MTLTATHEGRTYEMRPQSLVDMPRVAQDMVSRGWEPVFYHGTSNRTGRQRKNMAGIFYRSATTGQFSKMI